MTNQKSTTTQSVKVIHQGLSPVRTKVLRGFNPDDYPQYLDAEQLHALTGYPQHLLLTAP